MVEGGESFARLRVSDDAGLPVPLKIEMIARDQIPTAQWVDLRPDNAIRAGIEFGPDGRRLAYWALPFNPTDPSMPILAPLWQPERIPAGDVLHLFRELVENQLRGLTWLAPVMLRLRELDQYEDAALVRAKIAALMCGFIVNKDGENPAWQAPQGAETPTLEPGSLVPLSPGASVEFSKPPDDPNYGGFVKNHLKAIAAGLGVTYHQISGDLSEANYSSLRGGLVEFRRQMEQLQHLTIVPQFCEPVWRRFVMLAVLSGALDAPAFDRDPEPYLAVDWLPPAWDWVDPTKDIAAEVEAINSGLKSRTRSVAEQGYDIETLDAEIAADHERETKLGLDFTAPAKLTPPKRLESASVAPAASPPQTGA